MLNDRDAGRPAGSNGLVQLIDRRLFESEWLVVGHRLAPCMLGSIVGVVPPGLPIGMGQAAVVAILHVLP
jgi:hypothetical protein